MAESRDYRRPGRERKLAVRVSAAEQALIRETAQASGMSVQDYALWKILGTPPEKRRSGPPPQNQDSLPIPDKEEAA